MAASQPAPAPVTPSSAFGPEQARQSATGPVDGTIPPVRVRATRYTSPEFAAAEVARMWPRTWHLAASADHLADPGDWFEYRVGPYSAVLLRDTDGVLRGFQNTCRHRGNSLCSGAGSGRSELRCGYHGWTWDLAGQLRRVPGRKGFGALRFDELPLTPVSVAGWGPFVFANLDPNAAPLARYLETMPEELAWARLEEFRCTSTLTGEVAANWKTVADGFSETYHITTLHPELARCTDDVYAPQRITGHIGLSEQEYAVPSPSLRETPSDREVWDAFVLTQGPRMGATPGEAMPPIPPGSCLRDVVAGRIIAHARAGGVDLSGFDTGQLLRLRQYNVFPNCSVLATADTLTALVARPGPDPDRADLTVYGFRRAAPGAGRSRPADVRVAFEQLDLGQVLNQDAAVLAGVQRGLHQPGLTHVVLSQEERRIINTHRLLEHYLGIGRDD